VSSEEEERGRGANTPPDALVHQPTLSPPPPLPGYGSCVSPLHCTDLDGLSAAGESEGSWHIEEDDAHLTFLNNKKKALSTKKPTTDKYSMERRKRILGKVDTG